MITLTGHLLERRRRSPTRPRRPCGRRAAARACRSRGSARRSARSRRGRSRAASRSPRACRRRGPRSRARLSARSMPTSSGTSKKRIASRPRPMPPSIASSASACARLRGKPSSTKPPCGVGLRRAAPRSSRSSARRARARPDAMISPTCRPSSVPSACAARNMSPVETCGMPYSAEMRFACVPLPAPCGPRTSRFTARSPRRSASSSATPSGASCRARRRRRSAPRCRRARARSPARSRSA